jgi:hypothetical protein
MRLVGTLGSSSMRTRCTASRGQLTEAQLHSLPDRSRRAMATEAARCTVTVQRYAARYSTSSLGFVYKYIDHEEEKRREPTGSSLLASCFHLVCGSLGELKCSLLAAGGSNLAHVDTRQPVTIRYLPKVLSFSLSSSESPHPHYDATNTH